MNHQVAVIGEGVIDRFLEGNGQRDVIGGSPLNTAVAARRTGIEATWYNRVSTSPEGQAIAAYARDNSVAGPGMLMVDEPASIVSIEINEAGVPQYQFALEGASDWNWSEAEMDAFLSAAPVLQVGSLTAVLEPVSSALLSALRSAKKRRTPPLLCYDPNARPKAAADAASADRMRRRVLDFVAIADLVKVSDEDLEWLAPGVPPTASATTWSTLGPKLVIMTRGADGSAAFANGVKVCDVDSTPTDLVDTVGAGDTFMAWLLRAVVQDFGNAIPMQPQDIATMLRQAGQAAAITCSRKGCNPPYRAEVL